MDIFGKALEFVLRWEGGFVNDPDDPGGATNKGITQGTYNSYLLSKKIPKKSVKLITDVEVRDIYFKNYWCASGCHKIAATNQKLAIAIFNCAVNRGVGTALQYIKEAGKDYSTFLARCEKGYKNIVINNPKMGKFLKGWLNRNNALKKFLAELK